MKAGKRQWLLLPALLALLTPAWGGSFGVTPVVLAVPAPGTVATYKLNNPGSEPVQVQVSGWAWTQDGGADLRMPDDQLLIVPPLALVPARGTQVIRVARPAGSSAREVAFRIRFEEVPDAVPARGVMLKTRLRIDVPLFFTPRQAHASLRWASVSATGSNQVAIGAVNDGTGFARFNAITLYDSSRQPLAELRQPLYVLANSNRIWTAETLRPLRQGETVHLVVDKGGSTREHQLTVE